MLLITNLITVQAGELIMRRTLPALAIVAITSLALAGCSATSAPGSMGVSIVATTTVYGDIAQTIVGDFGTVTSLIGDSTVDPHSFEASARDQLAIADADLVIANGGGYDPFVEALVEASGTNAVVLEAVTASGLSDTTEPVDGFNEHVWYSFPGMTGVVARIADELSTIDPENAATFATNAADLTTQIEGLETRAAAVKQEADGGGAAVTEPVPLYLLEAVGLENLTPHDFTEAIEEGSDVPPLAFEQTVNLFTDGDVRILGYNDQTASPETERVRQAAESADVPVVVFTETLPEGADYVSWMTDNLDELARALRL